MPALPEYDTNVYPYAIITEYSGGMYFLEAFDQPVVSNGGYTYSKGAGRDVIKLMTNTYFSSIYFLLDQTNQSWGSQNSDSGLYNQTVNEIVWSNHDIVDAVVNTGTVVHAASVPLPVSGNWIYNGVELPALSDWDKDQYPYVYITRYYVPEESGYDYEYGYILHFSNSKLYLTSAGWQFPYQTGQTLSIVEYETFYEDVWTYVQTWEPGQLAIGTPGSNLDLFWSNVDVLDKYDNSVKFSASNPTPVAPKYSPALTSRTHSFTDTTVITEVTLVGLDPSKVYEVYWAIYDDAGDLLGHGVSNQIGEITGVETATGFSRIVNLQLGTTYSLYWHLAENESVLDTTFSNTVTTLGLTPGGTGDSGNSGSSGGSADSGGTGSDFAGGEDDISGSQGDGNTGILMQILNKLSAIFDFLTGDKEVEDTPEQALKDATSEVTQTVTDTFFGGDAAGQTVTSGNVGDLANTQGTIKQLFASDYTFGDFLAIFSGDSYYGFFSPEVAMDLNPLAYGSPAMVDMYDPYNQSAYLENFEKVRGKHG